MFYLLTYYYQLVCGVCTHSRHCRQFYCECMQHLFRIKTMQKLLKWLMIWQSYSKYRLAGFYAPQCSYVWKVEQRSTAVSQSSVEN